MASFSLGSSQIEGVDYYEVSSAFYSRVKVPKEMTRSPRVLPNTFQKVWLLNDSVGFSVRKFVRKTLSHFYLRREFLGTLKACICLKINGRGERI